MRPARRFFVAAAVAVIALVGAGIAALAFTTDDGEDAGPRVARNEPVEEETAAESDGVAAPATTPAPTATPEPVAVSGSKRASQPARSKGKPPRSDADSPGGSLARTGPTTAPWTATGLVLMMLGTRVLLFSLRGPRQPRNKDLWDSPPPPRSRHALGGA